MIPQFRTGSKRGPLKLIFRNLTKTIVVSFRVLSMFRFHWLVSTWHDTLDILYRRRSLDSWFDLIVFELIWTTGLHYSLTIQIMEFKQKEEVVKSFRSHFFFPFSSLLLYPPSSHAFPSPVSYPSPCPSLLFLYPSPGRSLAKCVKRQSFQKRRRPTVPKSLYDR